MKFHFYKWGFWMRISMAGLRGISVEIDRRATFSERYGHHRLYRIGRLSWKILDAVKPHNGSEP